MKTATGTWDKELTDAVLDGYEFTIYTPLWLAPRIMLFTGKCEEVLPSVLLPNSLDSIVTDPPYELGFMGKEWDSSGIAFSREMWAECFRVLKPGGHLLSFGGTRTWHRMAVAIEDAGFEIRDSIAWMHGQGFPKSLDVSKAIDKAAGATREVKWVKASNPKATGQGHDGQAGATRPFIEKALKETGGMTPTAGDVPLTPEAAKWQGWGTALKPAFEPIVVARKPFRGTVAANVLAHGTGALNIDGCRIGTTETLGRAKGGWGDAAVGATNYGNFNSVGVTVEGGRWPANVVLSEDQATELGEAARFFYCAKAPTSERPKVDGQAHATVKPLTLMRWLVQLVTPPGGIVGDPFAGSGTTLEAAYLEGFSAVGVELEDIHIPLIRQRLEKAQAAKLKEVIP